MKRQSTFKIKSAPIGDEGRLLPRTDPPNPNFKVHVFLNWCEKWLKVIKERH